MRLRAVYRVHRFQNPLPQCRVSRRVSAWGIAAGQSSGQGLADRDDRGLMAVWQRRVSQAPSGIFEQVWQNPAVPSRLAVNAMARMPDVAK